MFQIIYLAIAVTIGINCTECGPYQMKMAVAAALFFMLATRSAYKKKYVKKRN
jgi:hypothetical protein